ncbi:ABC transporter substrate-binding protein [Neisseria musculi]|uniref:Periplasmic binding family protein n=1 Tax=Neisseria musculi TaxID=1815583 RepID=A0A7H1MEZ8_9NEIS|nr:ABC transporter substrate-binding protein [Neisseria musculi]QNT60213.1 periplasmic binding family protein [Neisseria musculi]
MKCFFQTAPAIFAACRFSDGLCRMRGLAAAVLPVLCTAALAAPPPRVATADWSAAETLTAMKLPPLAVGDKRAYGNWVNYPALPAQTLDSGLRFQPNLERLRQIKPDMFVQSSWFAHLKPLFAAIAPVYEIDFAAAEGTQYTRTVAATRALGRLVNATAAAERLIADTERRLAQLKPTLAPYRNRPLAVVQFVDARHLRIYGRTSMYQAVLDKLALKNAWQGESNGWGFANITLVKLAELPPGTLLLVVKPHPANVRPGLEKSALWQRLPFAQPANRRVLPPSWSYGALPSMQHFAQQLAHALPSEQETSW